MVNSHVVLEFPESELELFPSLDTAETEGAFSYRPAPLNMDGHTLHLTMLNR